MKIKPCPFCNKKAVADFAYASHFVRCKSCDSTTGMCSSKERAVKAWNQRVTEGK